jgi:hypothetical protein
LFQSCALKYKGYDRDIQQWLYDITIFDPDFGEEMVAVVVGAVATALPSTVGAIKCYSNKGYSVNQIAKNLWLLFEFNQRQYPWWAIKEQTEWCLKWVPEYQPYHETIQMLMLFS